MGACLGVYLRSKDADERQNLLIPSFISAFFGISEPALYGVLIPRRKLLATIAGYVFGGSKDEVALQLGDK